MGACISSADPKSDTAAAASTEEQQGRPEANRGQQQQQRVRDGGKEKAAAGGLVPCGRRTNFGYDRDFASKYTIGKLLGHGQFGYTFVATDKAHGDRVAVKRIDKNKMILPIAVEDVKREVMILKALKGHENVVHFYNAYEDDSFVYIAMELCEGGELLDRILAKKNSRYTEKDAAVVVRQMLKVAAECHLHGLVHRDMKPENFLFKSTKEDSPLKATDFGLSDFIRPGKKFQDIVGSAYYVAPEVLKRTSGPESDVWSIGVITYILLCGKRPFWNRTENGIFKEVLKTEPDFQRKPWPSISNSAKDFVKKLLVKDPRVRLTAAQALSHSWVREGGDALEIPLDISVLSNMRQFVKYSRFKQFALRRRGEGEKLIIWVGSQAPTRLQEPLLEPSRRMDSDLWISRLEAAKRHLSLQLRHNSRSDRLSVDDFAVEEEIWPDLPCPYCYEDHDLASLCSHLEEEHPFESKVAVCPICSVKIMKDMLNHIIVQHGHLLKRSRPLSGYTIPSSQALSRLRKDLREAHLQLLLGNGVYRSSNTTLNAAADSFLSSFALDFPTSEAEKHSRSSISAGDDMCSNNESALPTWNLSFDSSLTHEEREQKRKHATTRATFVQDLLLSTLFTN